jgi:cellulose synthase/poly-beta-1,6-N-acetylglucosamine synthase-like glycosyltransferase
MGTGMAFPWKVICTAKLASGQVVEDLNLGLELGAGGHLPLFCPAALVSSTFPISSQAADHQRQRWEQGHVDLILAQTPRLLVAAIRRRSLGLFGSPSYSSWFPLRWRFAVSRSLGVAWTFSHGALCQWGKFCSAFDYDFSLVGVLWTRYIAYPLYLVFGAVCPSKASSLLSHVVRRPHFAVEQNGSQIMICLPLAAYADDLNRSRKFSWIIEFVTNDL